MGYAKDCKDNAVVTIREEGQTGSVDILRQLSVKNQILESSILPPASYRLQFSGYALYGEPDMYVLVDNGDPIPPSVTFRASASRSKVEIKPKRDNGETNIVYQGQGAAYITINGNQIEIKKAK